MVFTNDEKFMQLALNLAEKGRGKTSPNPMVGAVLVKNGIVISKGYHKALGTEHAETSAIRKAQGNIKGATLFVNLEPCCHTGRTGPCTEAIINSKISNVVLSMKDPNPLVNGKGIRLLKQAGIKIKTGILKDSAHMLNETYLNYHTNQRPFVILKTAQSLDGRIASLSGDSRWLSSSESLKYVHRLRSEVDAVVVGMGTIRKDNPSLTVRKVKGRNPYRIIISESLKFSPKTKLLENNSDYKTIIVSTKKSIDKYLKTKHNRGLIFWNLKKERNGYINLSDFIEKANQFNLQSILVEGGRRLATSFLKEGLVDKYITVTAPKILGNGISSVGELNFRKISHAIVLDKTSFFKSGDDMVFIGYPGRK